MNWYPLARAEWRALLSSYGIWLFAAIIPLWTYRPTYAGWNALESDLAIGHLQYVATLALPLAVCLTCYRAIVGERETGQIKFTLALPVTRHEILFGKLVGRAVGVIVPTFVGLGIVTVVGVYRYGLFSIWKYLAVLGVTLLYVVVLVGIVMSISAITERAITAVGALVLGLLVVFEMLWDMITTTIVDSLHGIGLLTSATAEGLLFVLVRLSPSGAYNVVTNWILGVGNSAELYSTVAGYSQPNTSTPSALIVDAAFDPGTEPIYLHEAGGLLVLLAWMIVPITIALIQFSRGDLV